MRISEGLRDWASHIWPCLKFEICNVRKYATHASAKLPLQSALPLRSLAQSLRKCPYRGCWAARLSQAYIWLSILAHHAHGLASKWRKRVENDISQICTCSNSGSATDCCGLFSLGFNGTFVDRKRQKCHFPKIDISVNIVRSMFRPKFRCRSCTAALEHTQSLRKCPYRGWWAARLSQAHRWLRIWQHYAHGLSSKWQKKGRKWHVTNLYLQQLWLWLLTAMDYTSGIQGAFCGSEATNKSFFQKIHISVKIIQSMFRPKFRQHDWLHAPLRRCGERFRQIQAAP